VRRIPSAAVLFCVNNTGGGSLELTVIGLFAIGADSFPTEMAARRAEDCAA
jgi:hypothetical protein